MRIHPSLLMNRKYSDIPTKAGVSVAQWCIPFPSPVTSFYAEHDAIRHGLSLRVNQGPVLAVSPPNSMCPPSLLTDGVG